VKADFEEKQRVLALWQDSHRDISSAVARTEEDRLQNEYNLAFSLYSELASQREQARIQVKEDTPVFTILEPVVVPLERTSPKRVQIMIMSLFMGLMLGAAVVLGRDYLKGLLTPTNPSDEQ
jgi:LPS O-antigen subunit length determinant protein (WzzB/FepE family)